MNCPFKSMVRERSAVKPTAPASARRGRSPWKANLNRSFVSPLHRTHSSPHRHLVSPIFRNQPPTGHHRQPWPYQSHETLTESPEFFPENLRLPHPQTGGDRRPRGRFTPGGAAASITLTNNDASGTSSFSAAGHWSNGQAPSATNTYQSAFTLRDNASATFQGGSLTILSGGDLRIKNVGTACTVSNLILNSGGAVDLGTSTADSLSGGISLSGGQAYLTAGTGGGGLLTVNSVISGPGGIITTTSFSFSSGPGTNIFTSANTYTGPTSIAYSPTNACALQLGNSNAVADSTVTLTLTNGLLFSAGIGVFNLGALAGSVPETLATTNGAAVTVSVGADNGSTTYSGALGGSGASIKAGTGTLTLSGDNSYTGNTTVLGGNLTVSGGTLNAPAATILVGNGTPGVTLDVNGRDRHRQHAEHRPHQRIHRRQRRHHRFRIPQSWPMRIWVPAVTPPGL